MPPPLLDDADRVAVDPCTEHAEVPVFFIGRRHAPQHLSKDPRRSRVIGHGVHRSAPDSGMCGRVCGRIGPCGQR